MQNKKKKGIFVLVILFIVAVGAMFLTDLFLAQVELTLNIEGEGELSPAPGVHSFDPGELVELEAEALPGWEFTGWEGDLTEEDASLELTLEEDMELTAVFEMEEYVLDLDYDEERGRIAIEPERENYLYGETVEIKAEAEEPFIFSRWLGDLEGDEPEKEFVVEGSMEILAEFDWREYRLSVEFPDEQGSVEIDPDKETYHHGESVALRAEAAEGWVFDRWSGDIDSEDEEVEFEIEDDMHISPQFIREEHVIVLDYDEERGSVQISPDSEYHYAGEEVYLVAEAEEGYEFERWSGDIESEETELNITVDDDLELKAEFTPVRYTLNLEMFGDGEVEIQPEKDYYYHGEEITLIAHPDISWEFLRWSGDIDSENEEVDIIIEDNKDIEVRFRFEK